MHVDSIEVFHVALPLRQPREVAGRKLETLETVLLRMQSGQDVGWGEASPGNAPTQGEEWAAGAFGCLRDWLVPAVAGTRVDTAEILEERLAAFRGNRHAKAALDTAWWDLKARREEKPLHELLGGVRTEVEVGVTFDKMDSIEAFHEAVGQALQAGFARVKLKFRPGWEVQMVDFVFKEFPEATLQIDCEGGLVIEQMEMLCRLDDFSLAMIEQPFAPDDLVGHAMAAEAVRTPICLDESVTTVTQAKMALELHSCQYINLKPGRLGGLTPAVAVHDACREARVGCYVAAVPQSAIGTRIGLALAAMENCTCPADYFAAEDLLQADLAGPLLPQRSAADDKLRVPLWSEPGLGIEPDMELIEKCCVDRFA